MLDIKNLSLSIGQTPILQDISLSLKAGKILGIVGESGSGKSLTALSAMQLLPNASVTTGSIRFMGKELLGADDVIMQDLRGDDMSMIFQEPMTALNPVHSIGAQISEGMFLHSSASKSEILDRTRALMERVGLPPSEFALERFPHELSGGQRQRIMIAMACAQNPASMIADEPTTALDPVLQAQILQLLRSLVDETGMGLILISHDLAVVAEMTDDIVVMREGKVVDAGPTLQVLRGLSHPYTKQLARASTHVPERTQPPVLSAASQAAGQQPLLEISNIIRDYPTPRKSLFKPGTPFRAVDDISLKMYAGQSIGLVGGSGCGKSTLARMILALDKPTSGKIKFRGTDLTTAPPEEIKQARRHMQVVFQDPFASFNPRHKVERLVAEPLYLETGLNREEKRARVIDALAEVHIEKNAVEKYAHEFSGGQRQRLAIARALITRPALIVADEPVSALDVSIRAQVLDLLTELRERLGLTYLFISHDLSVVRAICDEVFVMSAGKIVEHGPVEEIFLSPQTSVAAELIAAAPDLERSIQNRHDALRED